MGMGAELHVLWLGNPGEIDLLYRSKERSMKSKLTTFVRTILLGATAITVISAGPAMAQAVSQSEIDLLKAQIKALEKRLNTVQATQENKIKEIKEKQEAVELKYENGRPTIRTGDGNFEMALRGRMHFDMATYDQDDNNLPSIAPGRDLNEGGNFRRSELGMEGKFMRDWEYHVSYDFGGSGGEGGGNIKNAFIGYMGIKPLRIQIGAIQTPMTMEDSTSSNDITFIERASPVNLATSMGAQKGRTAVGLRGNTTNFFGSFYYTRDPVTLSGGASLPDESNNIVARAAYRFAPDANTNIHIGASGTNVFSFTQTASAIPGPLPGSLQGSALFNLQDRPELRVDGTRLVSTGNIAVDDGYVVGPEFGANWKNFYVQGEYYHYKLDRERSNVAGAPQLSSFEFDGWYVQTSWIVTGETKNYSMGNASFGAPRPKGPFGFGESLGAIELAARYSTVDLNDGPSGPTCTGTGLVAAATSSCVRGGEQDIVTLGVNWYPNRNIRFMLNYMLVDVDRQAYPNNPVGVAGGPNAQIGQDYDAIALRTQYSF